MSIETWNKYFPDDDIEPKFYNKSAKLNSVSGSYYVYNVLFSGITGQCIHLDNNHYNHLLVDFVTFSQLSGTDDGLGIYVSFGRCIQLHVCDINPDNNLKSNYAHSFVCARCNNFARSTLSSSDVTPPNYMVDSTISSAISDWATIYQYPG